jgi:hypothetical protein
MLGGAIAAQQRSGKPATDGADHDDSCVAGFIGGTMQRRQHHLGNQQLCRQIDLDLPPEHLNRNGLQRPGERCAGVVDQTEQRSGSLDHLTCGAYRILIEQVQKQRRDGFYKLFPETLRISLLSHGAEHVESRIDQLVYRRAANAG